MKVLHINCNYIGSQLHQNMINHLDLLDIQSKVFVATYDKKVGVVNVNDNVTVSECFKKNDRYIFDYKQRKILNAIESTYDINQLDMIHAYTLFTDGNSAMKLSKKYHIPYVVAVRNTDVFTFFQKMFYLRSRGVGILLSAKAIFFQSNSYRDIVINHYVPQKHRDEIFKKSYIIPNGIDDFWHENLFLSRDYIEIGNRLSNKNVKLVYAGGIDKNKNITLTCDAIKIMEGLGWTVEFTVVGKIKDQSVFDAIKDNVCYLEARPKEKLINSYRDADIFVMPSYHETFGLVYAEAMTQGLPVVCTRGQGFDGQFENGYVGFSIDPNSSQELSNSVLQICKSYEEMSKNCMAGVKKFKWNEICQIYVDIYHSIISNNVEASVR